MKVENSSYLLIPRILCLIIYPLLLDWVLFSGLIPDLPPAMNRSLDLKTVFSFHSFSTGGAIMLSACLFSREKLIISLSRILYHLELFRAWIEIYLLYSKNWMVWDTEDGSSLSNFDIGFRMVFRCLIPMILLSVMYTRPFRQWEREGKAERS